MDRAISTWMALPLWAKWATAIFGLIFLDSVRSAWGERNFVGGVAESFVAYVLFYGIPIGCIAAGIWIGTNVADRSGKQWLGWFVGVAAAFCVGIGLQIVVSDIPGVSWRLKAINNSDCYTDWDGRSNPVVCE